MRPFRSRPETQRGYILLAVMLLMTMMLLTLSIALPRIGQQIKREKEEELIHRGNEYKNAIRKFYRKNGRYPVTLEDLEKANNMRFLRKRYVDPFTGKDDWRLLHVGDVQLNLGGGASAPGQSPVGSPIGSPIGSPVGSPAGSPAAGGNAGGQKPGGAVATATGGSSQGGFGNPVIGGGPIIGVASTKKAVSIKELDQKDHYDEWLFFYDPRLEQQQQRGGLPNQNPNLNPGQNPNQNPGQNPNQNPGQNPNQTPNQNPGQNPGQRLN